MTNLKILLLRLYIRLIYFIGFVLVQNADSFKTIFIFPERFRLLHSKWKALDVFESAKETVPAYKDFIKNNMKDTITFKGLEPNLSCIPVTDKENYVRKYTIEQRCIDGIIPPRGTVIDESSGTSGKANNWVRGPHEREEIKRLLKHSMRYAVGNDPIFIINAFALGPWATGMNVSMSLVDVAILKSIGPDIKKIENTLLTFGPKYRYVIMGYPPFLKTLVDTAQVNWHEYNCLAIFGGEGMSEGMRWYLSRAFSKVFGSYGASDLEINIGSENDFTVSLRKLLTENKSLAQDLLLNNIHSYPMIFQYNPYDYLIETNDHNELIVTICRQTNRAPKIRYNIHDVGQVYQFSDLIRKLERNGIKIKDTFTSFTDLPLLFVYGRADSSVAYYGCKITPQNIEDTLFAFPELSHRINSFTILTEEDEQANKKLTIAFEQLPNHHLTNEILQQHYDQFFEKLAQVNQDFRESIKMVPEDFKPTLELHSYSEGPFAVNDIRLKKHYIQKKS